MTSYWPFAPPDSDHENWDRFSDAVATGELDPDGLMPSRLPGRPVRNFQNVAASLPPRPRSAVLGGPAERPNHGMPSGGPLSPPLGAVPFFETKEHS